MFMQHSPEPTDGAQGLLPPQISHLPRREREVAKILYLEGPMTAKELQAHLDRDLSHSALRTMLTRLCRKGIVKRRKLAGSHMPTDRRRPYLYAPALTERAVRAHAIELLAREYFGGSLPLLAEQIRDLSKGRRTES